MNLQIHFSIAALLLGFLFFPLYKGQKDKVSRRFMRIYMTEAAELILNIAVYVCVRHQAAPIIIKLIAVCDEIVRPLVLYEMADAVGPDRRTRAVFTVLTAVSQFISCLAFFTPLVFTVGDTGTILRGPLGYVMPALLAALAFLMLRLSTRRWPDHPIHMWGVSMYCLYVLTLADESIDGSSGFSRSLLVLVLFSFAVYSARYDARGKKLQHRLDEEQKEKKNISEHLMKVVQTLARLIDAKDAGDRSHSQGVADFADALAAEAGWSEEDLNDLHIAALLHDIGKLGVPDAILNKPSALNETEMEAIRLHTVMGAEVLEELVNIEAVRLGARNHHERWDGKGYPDGLKGEAIPKVARVLALADAYEAMTSDRVYRKALPPEKVRAEFVNGAGGQFDPELTLLFLRLLDKGRLNRTAAAAADSAVTQDVFDHMIGIMNEAAQKNSVTDALTGLPTRGPGERAIATAMAAGTGCLAFIDLDNLKKINDLHGHTAGDAALKCLGETILSLTDCISCRLGGDEFLMFMPGANHTEAEQTVQLLMSRFGENSSSMQDLFRTTLSIGLCLCSPKDLYADIYAQADKALLSPPMHFVGKQPG